MRDAGHRTPDIGQRTSDGEKSKNNISTPQGGGHKKEGRIINIKMCTKILLFQIHLICLKGHMFFRLLHIHMSFCLRTLMTLTTPVHSEFPSLALQ